ncbi:flavoprotein [Streptomyces sp. NPDC001985]|uniref:flavoprotein n=1 Tax=Streptomyces sp. NPDC001985 TaxID=3154406 RepID=UPI0033181754
MTTIYLFGSAAPPVFEVGTVIRDLQSRGADVCLGLTPTAADWLHDDLEPLEELTGHPVRFQYKRPGEPDVWPRADVVLFAPVTANSLNSWALCLTTAFVVGVVAEGMGKGIPTVAVPCVNSAYAAHPQIDRSVETLRAAGVTVLYGEGGFTPNQPGTQRAYPWRTAVDAALRAAAQVMGQPAPTHPSDRS